MFKQTKILLTILAIILLFASGVTYGRTNMSKLLVDEQFEDDNYADRGWNDNNIATQSGYRKEQDSHFGRVMYNEWTGAGGDGGAMADGVNSGAMFPLSRSQMDTGVTIYWASQWRNMMNNRATSDATHNGVRGNFGQKVMGHVDGEWLLDMLASGSGIRSANGQFYDRAMNVVPTYPNYAPDRIPYLDTVSSGGLVKTSDGPSYLEDGKWYEFVLYMEPNNAGTDGRSILWHRELGVSNWTKDWDVTQQVCKRVGNEGMVGIGTYLHSRNGTAAAPVRSYWGRFSVWEGNAMEDGSVDALLKGDDNAGPIDPPVDPVEPPTDELAITDLTVVSSRTAATVSWKTNKAANSVMDIGDTPNRGNMVRDDAMVTDHALNVEGLVEDTTYYFRVSSRTPGGETFLVEDNQTFDTDVTVVEPPTPPAPEIPDGIVVLEEEPVKGQGLMYDGTKWVAINLEDEVIKILQDRTKLIVS